MIEIDLADIHEPILACPNDPDDVKTLSDVAGAVIDEEDSRARFPRDVQEGALATVPSKAVP